MITHYDMVTGDIIDIDVPAAGTNPHHQPHAVVEPRLLSIDEARTCERQPAATPPAVVMSPIPYLPGD